MQVNSMPPFSASFGYLTRPIDQLEHPEQGVLKLDATKPVITEAGLNKLLAENDNYEVFEPKTIQDISDKMTEIIDDVLAELGLPTDIEVDIEITKDGREIYHINHLQAAQIESELKDRPLFSDIAKFGYGVYMMGQAEEARLSALENYTGPPEEMVEQIKQEILKVYNKKFMYDDNGQNIDIWLK